MNADIPESTDQFETPDFIGLSPRERELVRGLLSGLSNRDAMRAAGYSENYIRTSAGEVCRRPGITLVIRAAMQTAGITAEHLAKTMKEGLSACHPDGSPDFEVRHRYLESALRLGGHECTPKTVEESYEDRVFRLRRLPRDSRYSYPPP